MTSASTGSLLGGYRIEELAGHGGMGVVYRATQLALGRPVALKLISPELADDSQFRERFKRESRLAASIDHPNVIPVYEAGETNGSLFLSMRWVEGTSLEKLIRRGGGLEPERAAAVVAQVAAALDAAHARGLLHRDVKPANVLVVAGAAEHVYLTDFGLVKRMSSSVELTPSGQLLGTLDYIAPEQVLRKGADARSDVYSLGCVLFQCLTGRVPFEAEDEIAKIYAHLNDPPPRPSGLVTGLPAALDGIVARAMAKEPDERFPTAGDLGRSALVAANSNAAAETQRPTVAESPAGIGSTSARDKHRRASRRIWLWLGVAGALVGGTVVALLVARGDGDRTHALEDVVPDGTLLQVQGSRSVYVVKAGAKFAVPAAELAAFGYRSGNARTVSRDALREVPNVPRNGSLVRGYGSTVVWVVRRGTRRLAPRPAGANVAVVPGSALLRIPPPAGGRATSVSLVAPSFVTERKRFMLAARVRSGDGVPTGICVFYRIGLSGLKERANTPSRDGHCEARLKVGGLRSVRYSVHFVGERGWQGSKAATEPILVVRQPVVGGADEVP